MCIFLFLIVPYARFPSYLLASSIFELGGIIRHISRHICLGRVMSCGTTSLGGLGFGPVVSKTPSPTQPECGIGRRAVPVLASIAALTADGSTDMQWSRVAQARECAGMCPLLRLGSYLTSPLTSRFFQNEDPEIGSRDGRRGAPILECVADPANDPTA